ncbi:MAG: hypothetical protein KKC75_08775 [Nanoarchaeota archaeon]|nr:hypothetical protein [Nanoarchaeota archaeon]MBU1004966.1 hypothetical protein [Nanoarchaeota archaeon]MBU1946394.1 hypothetical protein [Nanoarchaeota archaeon]
MSYKKRAQAAMEFLMTYGWAILVVIIAIAAISYFGVLKPGKFLPRKCIIGPGIYCDDFKVNEDSVTLILKNTHGKNMEITGIEVEHCTGTDSGSLQDDGQMTFVIEGCSNAADEKFTGEINITYSLSGGLSRMKKGNIVSIVEEGAVVTVFSEDFETGGPSGHFGYNTHALPPDSYTGWFVQTGSWIIENGYFKNWFGEDIITMNSPASQSGMEIRAKLGEFDSAWRYPILILGWQDINNYYALLFNSGGNTIKLFKVVDGTSTTLIESSVSLDLNTWYWMELRWVSSTQLEGQILDLDWNSLQTVQGTISESWTTGNYGLRCIRGGACLFDDIQIRNI